MPAAETRILTDNIDAFPRGRILLVGAQPEAAEAVAARGDPVAVLHHDLRAHRACTARGVDSRFGIWVDPAESFDTVALVLPRETERLRMLLTMAAASLAPAGLVLLAGRNDSGIRSAGRHVGEIVGEPETLAYRHHCRLLRATPSARAHASPDAPSPDAPSPASPAAWRTTWDATAGGRPLQIMGYPGVFSRGHLDPGTDMLLNALPASGGARALDVGCGSGVVGAWLASSGWDQVDCVDTDAVAILAARDTLDANGGGRARVWASDVFSDVPENNYNLIASNPPFHAGTRATSEPGARLVHEARVHLTRGGELWLVANRFLAYPRLMADAFDTFDVVAEDSRYRVWRARA